MGRQDINGMIVITARNTNKMQILDDEDDHLYRTTWISKSDRWQKTEDSVLWKELRNPQEEIYPVERMVSIFSKDKMN